MGEEGVEADREQQQRAVDGLLPEGVDLQHHQRAADGGEQQRAERGAVDGARAAEDRDAADDHGGDGGELDAVAGGGVERAVAGRQTARPRGRRSRR